MEYMHKFISNDLINWILALNRDDYSIYFNAEEFNNNLATILPFITAKIIDEQSFCTIAAIMHDIQYGNNSCQINNGIQHEIFAYLLKTHSLNYIHENIMLAINNNDYQLFCLQIHHLCINLSNYESVCLFIANYYCEHWQLLLKWVNIEDYFCEDLLSYIAQLFQTRNQFIAYIIKNTNYELYKLVVSA